jgi:3-hydroxybutyryl-CoA dehydrogenase
MTAPRYAAYGAGRMGRGIAIAFAYAGHAIALIDSRQRAPEAAARLRDEAFAEIRTSLASLAVLGAMGDRVAPDLIDAIAARVRWVDRADAPAALAAADLVFEGVPETLDAKRDALAALGRHCRTDAIVTSTTSSILVTALAPLVAHPERFLNLHWLNPAYLIPVVELSVHPETSEHAVERTRAAMEAIGKVPVVCGVAPGYIVPRLQALVMNEAARMIEDGVATAEEIDRATRFGLGLRFAAIGVVEFIDFGGADILHHASREMAGSVDAARYAAPPVIGRMMAEGRLGLKSGQGFYDYRGRDPVAYRRDVLGRTLEQVKRAGLWRSPGGGASEEGARGDPSPLALSPAIRRGYVRVPHGQMHYAACGDDAAAALPVVLLHQTPRSWREYAAVLPRLGAHRRTIALDTAGFGASDATPEASIEAWAGAALAALDALGIGRAHVVGHHTGGVIAVELAAQAPDRVASLVLSSTPVTDAAFRRARAERPPIDAVAPSTDGTHLAALWQKRQAFYPAGRPELLQAFVADALQASGDVEGGHRAVAAYRMEDRLGAVRAPTLLLHATDDPFAAPHLAEWRQLRPDAQVATISGGVPLPDARPAEFAAAVLAFLSDQP